MAELLPEDVLTNIIRRLAPRYLAMSRCVCKTWCSIIDACNLLRADLLPHSVCGIFIHFNELSMSEFFSRPYKGPTISGYFDYLPHRSSIIDHCNGLLLLHDFVVNPATRQWMPLPPCSSAFGDRNYLVFDPALSSHYEVLLIPRVHSYVRLKMLNSGGKFGPAMDDLEWPPSPCIVHVFSSRTKEWEERLFVREGEAAGNVADMMLDWPYVQDNAVYRRGVLYVNCQAKFVMRILLSKGKYQVIKSPVATEEMECTDLYLGQSEKGVYCALYGYPSVFWIYILDESTGKMEWVFKYSCDIWPALSCQGIDRSGPWTLQDINYQDLCNEDEDVNKEAIVEKKFEWDSDSDNVVDTRSRGKYHTGGYITFLGFHPYKEVIFLCDTLRRGLAYHINSSKIQDLGNLHPTHYGTEMGIQPFIERSFPYTPWLGVFPDEIN
ncbi:hypothetical protein EJB05_08260 [Eragrostis curvula]|uniref:F-box domain-containing protein n=1 Tax=Eragrostis curvula TaxID=38414 RepID=A0A5J9WK31_9POAL|nr:hypothetical protein EJB05_08260 [Eragrostis curvula]